jgi:hypothetical protein
VNYWNVCEKRLSESIVNEDWLVRNCTGLTLDDSRTDDETAWLYYSNDDGSLNLLVLASLAGDQKTVDLNYIAGVDLDMPEEYEKQFEEGEEQDLLEFLKTDKKIHKMNIKMDNLKKDFEK